MFGSLSLVSATVVDAARHMFDSTDRRLRQVETDPRLATTADIEALVRAHGVPETTVWTVMDRMESADLDASAVWTWTMSHDAADLADLFAGADDAELAVCLGGVSAHAFALAA